MTGIENQRISEVNIKISTIDVEIEAEYIDKIIS